MHKGGASMDFALSWHGVVVWLAVRALTSETL
jgi:hypothetical protein